MNSLDSKIQHYNSTRNPKDVGCLCHAPFRSMFFGNRGYVFACCFNKVHLLGRYPEQSLVEIWNGSRTKQLQEALADNNFQYGCQGCKQLIEESNFEGLPARVYDNMAIERNKFPTRLEFELDNTCNYECIMCSGELSSAIRERRERKPPVISPYGKDFLEQLEPFIPHLQTAQFLGGEPFLIPAYFDIWEKMMEINPNIRISIQTNGSVLNNRVRKILEALKFSISVSIDGASPETYQAIRLNGKFEQVIRNLGYFSGYVKRKNTGLSVSFCPMPQNWREIPQIVRLCNTFNAEVFFNTVFHPAECSLMNMDRNELKSAVKILRESEIRKDSELECKNRAKFLALLRQMELWSQQSESRAALHSENVYASYSGLLEAIKIYAAQQDLSEGKSDGIIREITRTLDYIIEKSKEEAIYEKTLQYLLKLQVANLFEALPGNAPDRIYTLFKERVLKLI